MKTLLGSTCAIALLFAGSASAQDVSGDMQSMPGMQPAPTTPQQPATAKAEHAHPASAAADDDMAGMDMGSMTGAFGSYPMTREASGTSWQPDVSEHNGIHVMKGSWTYMVHATINGVYDWQGGPRGDEKSFVAGMLMALARRDLPNLDTLNFRAMLSPEPAMGKSGYPLLLASGETADGVHALIDRQHPHDFFMELSGSYTHRFSEHDNLFVYGGLPGEPAFGPPAFMHRQSILDSPEAPISHHWLDSTHITFGVVTLGWVHDDLKVEVSRYKGREPDQHRWDIETPRLDSTAVRLSWNPAANWALQASWADQKSPEQLDPADDERRWSVSAIYTRPFGEKGWWSTTAAWGRRQSTGGPALDAFILESAFKPNEAWTLFGRGESTRTDELTLDLHHGPVETVSKVSLGAIHDWRISKHVKVGLGGLYAFNFVPGALAASYGGDDPHGAMAFIRFKVD